MTGAQDDSPKPSWMHWQSLQRKMLKKRPMPRQKKSWNSNWKMLSHRQNSSWKKTSCCLSSNSMSLSWRRMRCLALAGFVLLARPGTGIGRLWG